MIYRFSIFLLFLSAGLQAQVITQISTAWDDKLDEWIIYTDYEDIEGLIMPKWNNGENFSEWIYELGDEVSGTISQTWKGNSNTWELLSIDGERIEFKTVWKDDYTEWNVILSDQTFRLKSKYKNPRNSWSINHSETEEYHINSLRETDPRDWIIEDFIEEGSTDLAIGVALIVIYHSVLYRI